MCKIPAGTAMCKGSTIQYYILTEKLNNQTEVYGTQVEYLEESKTVHAITRSRDRIIALLDRLRRGAVTPLTLLDVIEDWLLE